MARYSLAERHGFYEGLVWRDGSLWFSDFFSRTVFRLNSQGTLLPQAYVPGQPSGLGFASDGSLLIASMHDRLLLKRDATGHVEVMADLTPFFAAPVNDMVTDSRGSAYIGGFGYNVAYEPPERLRPAPLVLVEASGSARTVADGLLFPNGMALSPAEDRLFVAETFGGRITAFRIMANGDLSDRDVFCDLGELGPDGLCADADGLWAACPFAEKIVHVDWNGRIDRTLAFPGHWPVTVAHAGDGPELIVSLAATTLDDFHHGRALASIATVVL